MMPQEPGAAQTPPSNPDRPISGPGPRPSAQYHWYQKFSAVLFIVFCLEIGTFLMVFPWTEYWDHNYFSSIIPQWQQYWDNLYTRGGVSGIGVVNLYIAFIEILRLRRFAK